MANVTTTERLIFIHQIDRHDEANAPEVTTILIIDNSEGSTLRYRVGRTRTSLNDGQPFDVEPFETVESAEQYATELADRTREQYHLEGLARREARKWALLDLVAIWSRDDPAREAVEAVAEAIGAGIEQNVIWALEVYDPMPERTGSRWDAGRRSRPRHETALDDSDVIVATGSAG